MAGLYIHIPFCKSRCIYCGFYSTTLSELQETYVNAACEEIRLRKDYLDEPVSTIYLGGGTPSLLQPKHIEKIFDTIYKYNKVAEGYIETTMECNPDDITPDFAKFLSTSPINRVSMGAQSFSDEILQFIRRRHNSKQISIAVERLRGADIGNISIDLMFGFPNESMSLWLSDIKKAVSLGVEHISAYSLMYEEDTQLYNLLKKGKVKELDEDTSLCMYNSLIYTLSSSGYEHYEISNFAKPNYRSRHNSSYWNGTPYWGIGSAAHSYDKKSRQWNISDIRKYIGQINMGIIPAEIEILSQDSMFDDMITTRLRTLEGIDLKSVKKDFGSSYYDFLIKESKRHIAGGLLRYDKESETLSLTRKGLYVSDDIMSDLMHV